MRHNLKFNILKYNRGSLLLELLIVIALLAVILSTGSEAVFVSLQSNKVSSERDVALGLANEGLEAVRGTTEEKWQNIYGLTKGSQYYATSTVPVGKWTLGTGSQTVVLNGVTYTLYVIIENVNRCSDSTRSIASSTTCTPLATDYIDDPSTQKATVTVSWPNADPVAISEYFFRWRNMVCSQSGWVGNGLSGDSVQSCGTTTYDTIDATVSTSTGTLKLI
ncbi:MAG: hypothetical protein A2747_03920 [Candidatus Yonathbacteria bacterium RIFCSPHIGHO2_01_FULL_44_41]|uniref:Type 4 fimbrial biogenesis protein PilX N-terminal domain-containing protein n=1 Tax=Candidatus Yonathbacteria bacterium RIFCSPHIGHO2_02_FULL_44_14 TaxID=1802724 RepID=A0A1G2S8R6_9BACT|nr:MAG: hypothetical protein A2747_03920 [Candidatus Yonathbacteria bacterium RIFCSPHIGHO2_01_FULL_44_41]OHA81068.1 MAG: hypothetical protein A3D51_01810 [Candidatus Yonathbacteria bacterium RIFCSPHIGHO2_02_FULL_44_14]OHA81291.1 MAG: hypothetical protein A3B06_03520 [Candidatus Yonathbacteria bacterium RIFCSPLOWO2_01_FULL_43_20]